MTANDRLSWAKFSTTMLVNDKWLTTCEENPRAGNLYVNSILFCFREDSDGFITALQAKRILFAQPEEIAYLLRIRLWDEAEGGYVVHNYLDYQQSRSQREEQHSKKVSAGRAGGKAKASKTLETKGNVAPASHVLKQTSSKTLAEKSRVEESRVEESRVEDIKTHMVNSETKNNDETGFDEFWSAYPKHTQKPAARKAYRNAIAKTDQATLIRKTKAFAITLTDTRYAPSPAKWLDNEQWNDPLPSTASQQATLEALGYRNAYRSGDGTIRDKTTHKTIRIRPEDKETIKTLR